MLSIGAGVTGIMNAYHIQKFQENVEHVVYEKNSDIGGTWLENRYPGMCCSVRCTFTPSEPGAVGAQGPGFREREILERGIPIPVLGYLRQATCLPRWITDF